MSEGRWRSLFTSMQEGFLSAELVRDADGRAVDFRFLEVNPAFAGLTGLPADSPAGQCAISCRISAVADRHLRTVVESGQPENFEIHVPSCTDIRGAGKQAGRPEVHRAVPGDSERKRAEARRAATTELGDRLRDVADQGEISRIAAESWGALSG